MNRKLEDEGNDFRLLSGTEVDILKERLDFDDELLGKLDVVVASLHVAGNNEADNTKRLIAAAENPQVHMIGHLTGRLYSAGMPTRSIRTPSLMPAPRVAPGLS